MSLSARENSKGFELHVDGHCLSQGYGDQLGDLLSTVDQRQLSTGAPQVRRPAAEAALQAALPGVHPSARQALGGPLSSIAQRTPPCYADSALVRACRSARAPGSSLTAPTGSWRSWSAWRRDNCSSSRGWPRRCPSSAAPARGRRTARPGWAAPSCFRQRRPAVPASRVRLLGRRTAPACLGSAS